MRLTDLDPRWLLKDGKRVGFTFICPTDRNWRQSCFVAPTPSCEQWDLFGELDVQGCRPDCSWTIAGGIEAADFATMTVTPSLDGSKGGLWHGFITAGAIVGGLPA